MSCHVFYASGEVAVFYHTFLCVSTLSGRCVFFFFSFFKKINTYPPVWLRAQDVNFSPSAMCVVLYCFIQTSERLKGNAGKQQAARPPHMLAETPRLRRVSWESAARPCQVCAGVRVDTVDLKSITDCSVIIGLYKLELFIQHSEKCQDSCYQSRQVKSQLFGPDVQGRSRQMLNIHGVVGLKYDIHHDLCSWLAVAKWWMRFFGSRITSQIICRSLCASGEGMFEQVGVYSLLQEKEIRERWAESWRPGLLRSTIRASCVGVLTSQCRLIKTRCFVFLIARHAIRCWSTCEFDSAIGCWTSWFSPELWRLMLLISHPAWTPQRKRREGEREWTEIMRVSPW